MTTRYIKPGDALDYTNGGASPIAVNDIVVMGCFIAVAATDIAVGASGTVLGDGVFTLPKVAGTAMPVGTKVTWSVASGAVIVGAGVAGDVANCGVVVEQDAALNDLTARVNLEPGIGTAV